MSVIDAYVAEQWGRRWITIDTSRVALALARARIMGARYPYYLLADSPEGQRKEAEIVGSAPPDTPTHGNVRLGFVYERVPHITLKSIANNVEIDVIWERWQETLEPLRAESRTRAQVGRVGDSTRGRRPLAGAGDLGLEQARCRGDRPSQGGSAPPAEQDAEPSLHVGHRPRALRGTI